MPWILASLVSAFCLGWYELSTKRAVHDNAVLPVLFFANLCSAAIWTGAMTAADAAPSSWIGVFQVPPLTLPQHLQLLLKSVIVAASWSCSYFALKHAPCPRVSTGLSTDVFSEVNRAAIVHRRLPVETLFVPPGYNGGYNGNAFIPHGTTVRSKLS